MSSACSTTSGTSLITRQGVTICQWQEVAFTALTLLERRKRRSHLAEGNRARDGSNIHEDETAGTDPPAAPMPFVAATTKISNGGRAVGQEVWPLLPGGDSPHVQPAESGFFSRVTVVPQNPLSACQQLERT